MDSTFNGINGTINFFSDTGGKISSNDLVMTCDFSTDCYTPRSVNKTVVLDSYCFVCYICLVITTDDKIIKRLILLDENSFVLMHLFASENQKCNNILFEFWL